MDTENIKQLEQIVGGHSRVWVILSHSNDPGELIKDYFNRNFGLVYSKKYMRARFINLEFSDFISKYTVGIEVCLFEKKNDK